MHKMYIIYIILHIYICLFIVWYTYIHICRYMNIYIYNSIYTVYDRIFSWRCLTLRLASATRPIRLSWRTARTQGNRSVFEGFETPWLALWKLFVITRYLHRNRGFTHWKWWFSIVIHRNTGFTHWKWWFYVIFQFVMLEMVGD